MGVINRILLLLFSVIIIAGVGICAAVFLHAFPESLWMEQLRFLLSRKETLIALVLIGIIALHFLSVSLSFSAGNDDDYSESIQSDEMNILKADTGSILVSINAIKKLSERMAKTVAGVRDAKASVSRTKNDPLKIKMTLFITQGIDATIVGQAAAKEVQAAIDTSLKISNVPVDVFIKNISNERLANDRRVV